MNDGAAGPNDTRDPDIRRAPFGEASLAAPAAARYFADSFAKASMT